MVRINDDEDILFHRPMRMIDVNSEHHQLQLTRRSCTRIIMLMMNSKVALIIFSAAAAALLILMKMMLMTTTNSIYQTKIGPSLELTFLPSSTSSNIYKFKIIQIADIHLGEAQDTDWGAEQDVKSYHALQSILAHESNANLLILSGDQITANDVNNNATDYYMELGDFMDSYNTPWGLIFGNHDDADFGNKTYHHSAKTLRQDLLKAIQHYNYGMTQQESPMEVFGVSNYVLNVYLQGTVAVQIFMLDSGGGSLPKTLHQSQLDWMTTMRINNTTPAVVFQHVPTQQYVFNDKECVGTNGDGGFDPLDADPGIVDYLTKDGNVHFLAVGHNHGNSYCCPTSRNNGVLSLCFGRHSGYGGYGNLDRGARVYELSVDTENGYFSYKSWVQMESGDVTEMYIPATNS